MRKALINPFLLVRLNCGVEIQGKYITSDSFAGEIIILKSDLEDVMREKFPWWKLIAGYLFFLFFHQIYDILGGGTLAAILGEGIESIYAHMKMYFYAYLLVCLIDYFLRRGQINSLSSF